MEKDALEILNTLHKRGFSGFIVGGYVRDKLLGINTKDIDLCSNATPKDIAKFFTIAKATYGERYGTTFIKYRNHKYEITTFRKELNYLKHRSPETVTYIDKIDDDLIRRDFTINAICIDRSGKIYDPLKGRSDLKKRLIRCIGDTDKKIENDCLRILRAIRLAAILDFKLDDELEQAIYKYKGNLINISFDTKKRELDKILCSKHINKGLELISKFGLEDYLHIKVPKNIINTDLLGLYYQLGLAESYPLTKVEKEGVKTIDYLVNKDDITKMDLILCGLYNVKIAAVIKGLNVNLINQMYNELPLKSINDVNVVGEDICEILNVPPSPVIRRIKDDIVNEIVYRDLANHKNAIRSYLLKNKNKWYNELGEEA